MNQTFGYGQYKCDCGGKGQGRGFAFVEFQDGKLLHDDGDEFAKEERTCPKCGKEMRFLSVDEITDPQVLIDIAESELENRNWHSAVDMPGELWDRLKPMILKGQEAEAARAIMKVFVGE